MVYIINLYLDAQTISFFDGQNMGAPASIGSNHGKTECELIMIAVDYLHV